VSDRLWKGTSPFLVRANYPHSLSRWLVTIDWLNRMTRVTPLTDWVSEWPPEWVSVSHWLGGVSESASVTDSVAWVSDASHSSTRLSLVSAWLIHLVRERLTESDWLADTDWVTQSVTFVSECEWLNNWLSSTNNNTNSNSITSINYTVYIDWTWSWSEGLGLGTLVRSLRLTLTEALQFTNSVFVAGAASDPTVSLFIIWYWVL